MEAESVHRCRPGRQVGLDGPCRPVYAGAVERARRGSWVGHRRQNPNHTRRRRASNKAGFTHLAQSSDRQTALSTTPISGDRRGALRSDAPRQ